MRVLIEAAWENLRSALAVIVTAEVPRTARTLKDFSKSKWRVSELQTLLSMALVLIRGILPDTCFTLVTALCVAVHNLHSSLISATFLQTLGELIQKFCKYLLVVYWISASTYNAHMLMYLCKKGTSVLPATRTQSRYFRKRLCYNPESYSRFKRSVKLDFEVHSYTYIRQVSDISLTSLFYCRIFVIECWYRTGQLIACVSRGSTTFLANTYNTFLNIPRNQQFSSTVFDRCVFDGHIYKTEVSFQRVVRRTGCQFFRKQFYVIECKLLYDRKVCRLRFFY